MTTPPRQDEPQPAKMPYEPPRLRVFGSLADLTAAKGGMTMDGMPGFTMTI